MIRNRYVLEDRYMTLKKVPEDWEKFSLRDLCGVDWLGPEDLIDPDDMLMLDDIQAIEPDTRSTEKKEEYKC